MQSDTTLVLGSFEFGGLEIPAEIRIGGTQRLSVHELVGGTKIVDAMGRSDRALEWSGLLLGKAAITRARYLDTIRAGGMAQPLMWSEFTYMVMVREFEASYQQAGKIPYRIVCEVVSDLASPVTVGTVLGIDQAVIDGATNATALTVKIADAPLTGYMATLNSAISPVSSFAHGAQSTINSVLQPLAAVQARAQTLITLVSSTVASVATFGGLLPGNTISQAANSLTLQAASMGQLGNLYQLKNELGRISSNLGAINSAQASLTTAGGNLYQIAQQKYGDAMAWTGIAKANGLTDPFIQGVKTLTIPPSPDVLAGVLAS